MIYSAGSLAITSLLIGVFYIFFLRSFDIYEKDPWLKLFISFLVGGLLSIFFAGVIYQFFDVEYTMSDAIFKIGITEESAKMIAFFIIFWLFGKDIDEPVDGVLYMSSIALGFACIESISYAQNSSTPYLILFLRAFVSVVGHITFTGYMGIALFIHLKVRKNYTGIILSLSLAALAHGLYDGLLFNPHLNFLFKYLFVAVTLFHLYMIRIALNFSGFRQKFSLDLFEEENHGELSSCISCKKDSVNRKLAFWKIYPYMCSQCGNILFTSHSFRMLMRYFRPVIRTRRLRNRMAKKANKAGISLIDGNEELLYNHGYGMFSMNPVSLTGWIRSSYRNDRKNALQRPVSGPILRYLGLRYLE